MPRYLVKAPEFIVFYLEELVDRHSGSFEEVGEPDEEMLSEADKQFLGALCNQLIDAEEVAAEVGHPAHCGDLVEINGAEYVVVAETITGCLELQPRGEFDNEAEEDHPLSH